MVHPELRILITLGALSYASYLDLKHRSINDVSWKFPLVAGAAFAIVDALSYRQILLEFAISIVITGAVLIPLERLRKIGGGDVKIMLGLASVLPTNPYVRLSAFPIFSLSVFANAIFITAFASVYFLALNLFRRELALERLGEVRFLLLGYKKKASTVTEHERIMKRIGDYAWVTPALPFTVPLTLGFVLALAWGDIPSYLVLR